MDWRIPARLQQFALCKKPQSNLYEVLCNDQHSSAQRQSARLWLHCRYCANQICHNITTTNVSTQLVHLTAAFSQVSRIESEPRFAVQMLSANARSIIFITFCISRSNVHPPNPCQKILLLLLLLQQPQHLYICN